MVGEPKTRLVPIEPTREMWAAAGDAVVSLHSKHHDAISEAVWSAMLSAAPPTSEVPSAWRDIEPTADMIAAGHEALHRIGEVDHDRHVLMLGSSVGAARGVFRAMAAVAPATPGAGSGGTGGDDREGLREQVAREIYARLHHLMRVSGSEAQQAYERTADAILTLTSGGSNG